MLPHRGIFLLLNVVMATPWMGPTVTPVGLWSVNGISPRPTPAPGLNGIPRELLKRKLTDTNVPPNYCGFIDSDTDSILSCDATSTCVSNSFAFGCCGDLNAPCTEVYTTCVNYLDYAASCDLDCQENTSVAKCLSSAFPFCAAYSFDGGKYLWQCLSTVQALVTVEIISSWTATFGNPKSTIPMPTNPTSSPTPAPVPTSHAGISPGAIGGIVAGVAVLAICCAILVYVCIRRRNSKRAAEQSMPHAMLNQGTQPQSPPPMQQQQQQQPPSMPGRPLQYQPKDSYLNPLTPGSNYESTASHGQPSPIQSNFLNHDLNHRTSTVTSNPFSPVPSTMSGSGNHTVTNSESGDLYPPYSTPSPPPMMAEADSKIGNLNTQSMQNNQDIHRQQSPLQTTHGSPMMSNIQPMQNTHGIPPHQSHPPHLSEVQGSPMTSNMQPMQYAHDIQPQQSPPPHLSEVHGSPMMSTTQFEQGGTYGTKNYPTSSHQESHRQEMPGAPPQAAPWEMGSGR